MRARTRLLIAGIGLAGFTALVCMLFTHHIPEILNSDNKDFNPVKVDPDEIIVVRWTKWWGLSDKSPLILTSDNCPYLHLPLTTADERMSAGAAHDKFKTCRISYDRRYFHWSDALVFHSWDLIHEKLPLVHDPHHIWVYLQEESPIYTSLDMTKFANVFNWTMTYRRDSDVYHPYGHIVPMKLNESLLNIFDFKNFTSKPKLALWIASSCESQSKREDLVHVLQEYIHVDVYGKCGKPCETTNQFQDCYGSLSSQYKFYLSFENSFCVDYITEKYFNAMNHSMVPVVFGGNDNRADDYVAIAPKNSYIDANKFKGVKELADYLVYLDKNDSEYSKYLEWKLTHKVVMGQGWCNLCQKIYEQRRFTSEEAWVHKSYSDLWQWWTFQGNAAKVGHRALSVTDDVQQMGTASSTSACILSKKQ